MAAKWTVAFCVLVILSTAVALDNGVGVTPAMGWNPYNAYSCDTTEDEYYTSADLVVSLGLRDVGYQYINLDCGWQSNTRSSNGTFQYNTTRFPKGIPALASYVHDLDMEFGVYSDGGYYSCDNVDGAAYWIGSLGYEASDAKTFASWGADYLKYDNCYSESATDFVDFYPTIEVETHYITMESALKNTSREILFSICEWGVQDPARWPASDIGNSWRISNDIGDSWADLFRIINQLVPISQFAEPGGFNDLDLLEVGNDGLTTTEQQTHFAFWAAAKSPLMVSTDLTAISSDALSILLNERIIALNQDTLGASISFKRRYTNDYDVWASPLADGSTVALILNWEDSTNDVTFSLTDVGFSSADAADLISDADLGTIDSTYTASIDAHGVLVLKLTNGVAASTPDFTYYPAASSSNTLADGAVNQSVTLSASAAAAGLAAGDEITDVGYVGVGGTLTFNGIDGGSTGGSKLLSIDYINADYAFYDAVCSNCRNAYFSVNGGDSVQVQMPISGQSWDILFTGYLVELDGFVAGEDNTIEISNPNAYTPDFYRIGVAV